VWYRSSGSMLTTIDLLASHPTWRCSTRLSPSCLAGARAVSPCCAFRCICPGRDPNAAYRKGVHRSRFDAVTQATPVAVLVLPYGPRCPRPPTVVGSATERRQDVLRVRATHRNASWSKRSMTGLAAFDERRTPTYAPRRSSQRGNNHRQHALIDHMSPAVCGTYRAETLLRTAQAASRSDNQPTSTSRPLERNLSCLAGSDRVNKNSSW